MHFDVSISVLWTSLSYTDLEAVLMKWAGIKLKISPGSFNCSQLNMQLIVATYTYENLWILKSTIENRSTGEI